MESSCFLHVQLCVPIVRQQLVPQRRQLPVFSKLGWNVTQLTSAVPTFASEAGAAGPTSKQLPYMTLDRRGMMFLNLILQAQGQTGQDLLHHRVTMMTTSNFTTVCV